MKPITLSQQKERIPTQNWLGYAKLIETQANIVLRYILTIACIVFQGACLVISYIIIFFVGYGKLKLEPDFLKWLLGVTLATVISNTVFVYKNLFPGKKT